MALALLAFAGQLAGCSFLPETPMPWQSTDGPAEPPARPSRHASPAPRQAAKPAANPSELVGLDEGAVRRLLGEPSGTRNEGAARVLSYRNHACTLDVVFLMDVKSGDLRVLTYDLAGTGRHPLPAEHCYGDLRKPR